MEVEIRLGLCNNAPVEWIRPENGWRYTVRPMAIHCLKCVYPVRRVVRLLTAKHIAKVCAKCPGMPILVRVASIQMRFVRAELGGVPC